MLETKSQLFPIKLTSNNYNDVGYKTTNGQTFFQAGILSICYQLVQVEMTNAAWQFWNCAEENISNACYGILPTTSTTISTSTTSSDTSNKTSITDYVSIANQSWNLSGH